MVDGNASDIPRPGSKRSLRNALLPKGRFLSARSQSSQWQDRAVVAEPAIPEALQTTYQRLQWKTYLLFDEARSSLLAHAISIFILIAIVMSIIAFTLKTMPELAHIPESAWLAIDVCSILNVTAFDFLPGEVE